MIHRIVKNRKKSGTLLANKNAGRALTGFLPKAVELNQMRTPMRRMLILTIELVVGMLVIGALLLGLFYYSLQKGEIDLNFVVPSIEQAINDQLTDISVKIESAFVGKNRHSAGVHFRLRNIVLVNKKGEIIATAPLAAVDLNGRALMWGRIAPSQVVFIKPTLDLTYNEGKGLSLSYAANSKSADVIGDLLNGMEQANSPAGASTQGIRQLGKIELMKAVTAAFEEARSNRNTSSYLTQFGVRDARVNFSAGATRLSWKVPDFIIDLKHSDKGSLIRGFGQLGIGNKEDRFLPWKLRFQTQQFDNTKGLKLDVGFKDLSTASLYSVLPEFVSLKNFNIPIDGKFNATLNKLGELQSAFANIQLADGSIKLPWLNIKEHGFERVKLDLGDVKLAYTHKGQKLHILPSPFRWGNNRTILSGLIEPALTTRQSQGWKFTFKGGETRLAADDFNLEPMIVDDWWITGTIFPEEERMEIAGFHLRAGNTSIKLKGVIDGFNASPGLFLKGKLSSISIPVLKRLWPRIVALEARKWVGESIKDGRIISGDFNIAIPAGLIEKLADQGDVLPEMIQLNLKLSDLVVEYYEGLIPIMVPEASVKITGRQLSVEIPKGRLKFDQGEPLKVSHGSFTIADLRQDIPGSDLNFRVAGRAGDLFKFIKQPALKLKNNTQISTNKIDGKLRGVISMHIPLSEEIDFNDIALDGDLRLRDMKSKKLFGDLSVDGGTVNIKVTQKAVGANGGVVIKGIPTKLNWQHIFGARPSRQPPLRLAAVLNKSSRKKLGLTGAEHLLTGDVPVIIAIAPKDAGKTSIQVRADLTSAGISTTAIGWSKPPGIAAVLQFDFDKVKNRDIILRDFSLAGNQLLLQGSMRLQAKTNKLMSFSFPKFSYKLARNISVTGKRKANGVMSIKANVQNLDGMRLLRDRFFKKGAMARKTVSSQGHTDYDLLANIKTIAGGKGSYISGATLRARQRQGKLSWLNFKGLLNGRSSIAILLEPDESGQRVLKTESANAGATFRMIGLYPKVRGGQLSLKVEIDHKGAREKAGTLWVRNFVVISSQTVKSDMNAEDIFKNDTIGVARSRKKARNRANIVHTKLEFDQLKAPFSYGDGQFILHDSYVNGPVIGATLRGKIDFRTERMSLGGTYVPLYGLNAAIGEIPVISELFVGRQGEGVFGVTFAIEGPTAKPTVIVNPVSLLTPGVLRQIFDFNNSVKNKRFEKLPKRRKKRKARQYRQ